MNKSYDDIIHLPHHVSATHPHMSMAERAAQFSPFAALTGYEDVLTETARKTDQKIELDETIKEELDQKLHLLAEHVQNPPSVSITYFQPDDYKEGGQYVTKTCRIRKINSMTQMIQTTDGSQIPICNLLKIESSFFPSFQSAHFILPKEIP